jgi:two-component system invasion response regulator UvrY
LIRLLIGDANLLVRTGLKTLLTEMFPMAEVGEAATGAAVLASLRQQPWNLCVLDISLPERGGLEIARHVRKGRYKTILLFLSAYSERQYAASALREGARGFIFRDCTREELSAAVRAVLAGGCYVSPWLSDQLIAQSEDERPPYTRLSQRELQIFRKLAQGTALTVISKDLSISPKSVSTYRSRILEKMRCRNNAEITQYAVREGLI